MPLPLRELGRAVDREMHLFAQAYKNHREKEWLADKQNAWKARTTPEFQCGLLQDLLTPADIIINGDRPWDPQVRNPALYDRAFRQGELGIAEAYMDGLWDSAQLDVLMTKVFRANLADALQGNTWAKLRLAGEIVANRLKTDPFKIAEAHYDLPPILFEMMLGKRMIYSCAFWEKGAKTLDEADKVKLKLIGDKLRLKPGMKVLDVGGGFGTSGKYWAENYGVSVVNLTVSKEQKAKADELNTGLPVTTVLMKFQDLRAEGEFDRVVSAGMFEHVGHRSYRQYMEVIHRALKHDGIFLLHTIGRDTSGDATPSFISKYIFPPPSEVPKTSLIASAYEGLFVEEDKHNIGPNYDPTLMAWQKNFEEHWEEIKPHIQGDSERFRRMWNLYLLGCAGAFRARALQVWQFVFSKGGIPGGYEAVR